eukprot:TRINITY_DN4977_c0_g1_i2.p1 TRINITY_DN4977_c0_g1~~TRINITY_DN4977_c0_g1_i2.p1  ORF type:complete len:168 (-),score=23.26 TRINITY_DN4977_c0_g1_i2:182-685(-)
MQARCDCPLRQTNRFSIASIQRKFLQECDFIFFHFLSFSFIFFHFLSFSFIFFHFLSISFIFPAQASSPNPFSAVSLRFFEFFNRSKDGRLLLSVIHTSTKLFGRQLFRFLLQLSSAMIVIIFYFYIDHVSHHSILSFLLTSFDGLLLTLSLIPLIHHSSHDVSVVS